MLLTLPAVLAVDGGNSKTDLALVAADGSLLATVRGPGVRSADDLGQWLDALAGAHRPGPAGGRGGAGTGWPPGTSPPAWPTPTCPRRRSGWPRRCARWAGASTVAVANDTFAVLRAGLDHRVATGASALGRRPSPAARASTAWPSTRTGGPTGYLALGGITGDWGGGHGLGQAALWWAIRAEDGRGPQTALRDAVAAHFGVPTVRDVTIGLHLGKISEEALLGARPGAAGRRARRGTRSRGTWSAARPRRSASWRVAAMRRLGLTALPTPVVLGGGLLTARDPLLLTEITERITAAAPQASVIVVAVPPVAGAALLGLDHVGAGPEAERRLRAAYDGRAG